jgi:hypothetical protein
MFGVVVRAAPFYARARRKSKTAKVRPWRLPAGSTERIAQFRSLAALAAVFLGIAHALVAELRAAERDDDAAAAALALLDRVPTLQRRKMLSVFARGETESVVP